MARIKPGGRLLVIDCIAELRKLKGRLYVLRGALKQMGLARFPTILPRLLFFFPKRFEHVLNDQRKPKQQGRYSFKEFQRFYSSRFQGAEIGRIGCAAYLDWIKPDGP